ncbi:hypothetical protein K493DRAFT_376953 [Basidiobolus meristosporus CBS 931.73]|uniref:Uncharacterized protein n=1 Tax=Basidiobolus meristosporus CBS 931.73 TaxID=1314790 RepID=A0A1Y1Y3U5_9FUNG|nr:hypothetical protein K493DRAFT_376953 [Basidiobolus meristosporus CBS 931.73]|eukprot:ORX92386.1 hypothetical protein K493DRAFT_376953 [Basidiobolus meristosporus CBS 931.73]
MYVTSRATKSIMSQIGSFSLTNDAVFAINGFLDEILYLLIVHLPTDKMDISGVETSLLKLVPNKQFAKEAICSAHSFSKKTLPSLATQPSICTANHNRVEPEIMALPDANETVRYEQLRAKCLRYSALGTEHANPLRLLLGPQQAGEDFTSITVIFITALLEYVARFLINSVAVMAKQQLKTYIGLEEVFNGLDVDSNINELFRTMIIYTKIQTRVIAEAIARESKNAANLSKKKSISRIPSEGFQASFNTKYTHQSREKTQLLIETGRQEYFESPLYEASPKKGKSLAFFLFRGKSRPSGNNTLSEIPTSQKTGFFRYMPPDLDSQSPSQENPINTESCMPTTGAESTLLHKTNESIQTSTPTKPGCKHVRAEAMSSLPQEYRKTSLPMKKAETVYECLKSAPITPPKVSKKYIPRPPVVMRRSILYDRKSSPNSQLEHQRGYISKQKESIYDFLRDPNSTMTEALRTKTEKTLYKPVPPSHYKSTNPSLSLSRKLSAKRGQQPNSSRGPRRLSMPTLAIETFQLPGWTSSRKNNQNNLIRQRSLIELPHNSFLPLSKSKCDTIAESPELDIAYSQHMAVGLSWSRTQDTVNDNNRPFYPLLLRSLFRRGAQL